MRTKIIAGNWKMNGTRAEAESLINELMPLIVGKPSVEVVLCPPFPILAKVEELIEGSRVALGGQDVFWKEKGAYTGQTSAKMLIDLGCKYVIVGHSERRGRFGVPEPDFNEDILAHFGDNNTVVNRKTKAALAAGLIPIVCVGETLAERKAEDTDPVIIGQVSIALQDLTEEQVCATVFAYEPVWAIGTGEVCASDEADRVCGVIRATVGRLFGSVTAQIVRIQYGGSVKPDNAQELLGKPNIDGALVGGASLKAADFAAIVNAS